MFIMSRAFSLSLHQNSNYFCSKYVFNPQNVQSTAEKFSKIQIVTRGNVKSRSEAAVLVPICEVDGKVSLLYTLRAVNLRTHRGQVSFPGGKKDDCDTTIEETAIRETVEELGIEPNRIEIWGKGKAVVTKYKTSVVPVIGRIKDSLILDQLKVNPHEVEEVFAVPLADLCDSNHLRYTQFRVLVAGGPFSAPVFLGGKHKVWGLTGFITHMFLKCLLPSDVYTHPIKFVPPTGSFESVE